MTKKEAKHNMEHAEHIINLLEKNDHIDMIDRALAEKLYISADAIRRSMAMFIQD